jgi:hypothetical protein
MRQQDIEKYIERLKELAKEGTFLAKTAEPTNKEPTLYTIRDSKGLEMFYTSVENNIANLLGNKSAYYANFLQIKEREKRFYPSTVNSVCGIIVSIVDDYKKGTLASIERLVSGDILADILEQAQELNDNNYPLPSAVCVRIGVETALKRLASMNSISTNRSSSDLKNMLKNANIITNVEQSEIEVLLRFGNSAAHNDSSFAYTKPQIDNFIQQAKNFVTNHFPS